MKVLAAVVGSQEMRKSETESVSERKRGSKGEGEREGGRESVRKD